MSHFFLRYVKNKVKSSFPYERKVFHWIPPSAIFPFFIFVCFQEKCWGEAEEEVKRQGNATDGKSIPIFFFLINWTNRTKLNSHLMLFIVSIFYYIPNHIKSNGICSLIELCLLVSFVHSQHRNHVQASNHYFIIDVVIIIGHLKQNNFNCFLKQHCTRECVSIS